MCENIVSKFSSGKTVQNIKKVKDWPQTAWNMWGCDNCDITDDFCHLWTQNNERVNVSFISLHDWNLALSNDKEKSR